MGREAGALAKARANIDAWNREIEGEGLDAILITISGCGTTVKDYGFMLRTDPAYAEKAARVSGSPATSRSIWRRSASRRPRKRPSSPWRIIPPVRCSTASGFIAEPRTLTACGFVVKEIAEGHLCCGSAGTYNILQPDIAGRLLDRKIGNIDKIAPDVIAAGNIGCITQIAGWHSHSGGAYGRVDRLGDRRTGAGAIEGPLTARRRRSWRRSARQGKKKVAKAKRRGATARKKQRGTSKRRSKGEKTGRSRNAGPPKRSCRHATQRRSAAADERTRTCGDADRGAAVAVSLVGAG